MSALKYWIWLSACVQVSPATKMRLLEHYGDAMAAYFAPLGDYEKIENVTKEEAKLLEARELGSAERIIEACAMQNIRIVTYQDADYPNRLRHIYAPPLVLYVKGTLPPIDEEAAIAVIGTRRATPYGIKMARRFGYEISKCGGLVVSGVTSGIDMEGVRGALLAGGKCVGVLGTSHDKASNPLNDDIAAYGALLSEYPPGTDTHRSFFRMRNRITAGLSVGVVVIEAPEQSGTRLFATEASEQGKEIFAVPGNADAENSRGTNALIKEGAIPVTDGWEVVREFAQLYPARIHKPENAAIPQQVVEVPIKQNQPAPETETVKKVIDKPDEARYIDFRRRLEGLNDDQKRIMELFRGESVHVDTIISETGLKPAKVLSELTMLQLKGLVKQESGKRFSAVMK